jgi:hypothetical protein
MLFGLLAVLALCHWRSAIGLCGEDDGTRPFPYNNFIDAQSYIMIANGQIAQVESPFSKRALYPLAAGWISRQFHLSLPTVFLSMAIGAYMLLIFCLAELLRLMIDAPWLALLFALTPQAMAGVELGCMPDLLHMGLMSLFLLLWWRGATKSALVLLLLAFLTRENTMLACLFLGYTAWRQKAWGILTGALAVLVGGMAATGLFVKWGLPNKHHLPDFIYLLGKVPYYFLFNLAGLRIWSDVRPLDGTPWIVWHLPWWLRLGADQTVGICRIWWNCPIFTAANWLTCFGVGPFFLGWSWRQRARFERMPMLIHFCFVYGLVSFLFGPTLGDWIQRLIGYGWPLFWIALPYWLVRERVAADWTRSQKAVLFVCFWLTSWWPVICKSQYRDRSQWLSLSFIAFYLVVWRTFRGQVSRAGQPKSVTGDARAMGEQTAATD